MDNDDTRDLDYRSLYGIPPDAFVVGWVGRMTGVKDTDAVAPPQQGLAEVRADESGASGHQKCPHQISSSA